MEQNSKENASGFRQLYQELLDRVLKGRSAGSEAARQAAFDDAGLEEPVRTLIDKVANGAYRITDSDVDAVRAAGKSEDEIFELVICGAVGQASRQYNNGLAALREAVTGKKGGSHAS